MECVSCRYSVASRREPPRAAHTSPSAMTASDAAPLLGSCNAQNNIWSSRQQVKGSSCLLVMPVLLLLQLAAHEQHTQAKSVAELSCMHMSMSKHCCYQHTRLVFHRGDEESSLAGLALGLNTKRDLIMNSSANTAPVAAEPDKISAWVARTALCVRIRTGRATNMEATQIPCTRLVEVNECQPSLSKDCFPTSSERKIQHICSNCHTQEIIWKMKWCLPPLTG